MRVPYRQARFFQNLTFAQGRALKLGLDDRAVVGTEKLEKSVSQNPVAGTQDDRLDAFSAGGIKGRLGANSVLQRTKTESDAGRKGGPSCKPQTSKPEGAGGMRPVESAPSPPGKIQETSRRAKENKLPRATACT
jgi:hypothetical protein